MFRVVVFLLALLLTNCAPLSPPNQRAPKLVSKPIRWRVDPGCMETAKVSPGTTRDALAVECGNGDYVKQDFIALALSGGGVKAAIFSAESMFYLQALGLLHQADVISSVSGGSFTAGLYALSCDPADTKNETCKSRLEQDYTDLVWRHDDVLKTVGQGYGQLEREQIARLLVPLPFVRGTISADHFASYIDSPLLPTFLRWWASTLIQGYQSAPSLPRGELHDCERKSRRARGLWGQAGLRR